MLLIDALGTEPPTIQPLPAADQVRPRVCGNCHFVAGAGPELLFHGHGVRIVVVVIPGKHWHRAQLVTVEVRRFRCKRCGSVVVVRPPGTLPRHLYSLFSIVSAWWQSLAPPGGEGLDDEAVNARQGVDCWPVGPEEHRTGRRRWRSLARWAAEIGAWWPGRAVAGSTWRARVASLLAGFAAEAGEAGLAGVLARAVASHAGAGAVM
jgi:hypothetical protein